MLNVEVVILLIVVALLMQMSYQLGMVFLFQMQRIFLSVILKFMDYRDMVSLVAQEVIGHLQILNYMPMLLQDLQMTLTELAQIVALAERSPGMILRLTIMGALKNIRCLVRLGHQLLFQQADVMTKIRQGMAME